nr:PKD domain-containing protein [Bacteroidota bacterium]
MRQAFLLFFCLFHAITLLGQAAQCTLKVSVSRGCVPQPVQFSISTADTGAIASWSWDFGDSTSSALPSPSHVYQK